MKFTNSVVIDAPRNVVFGYLTQFEHIPEWNYAISRTEKVTPGVTRVGTVYSQIRYLPATMQEEFTVTALDEPSRVTIEGQFGPFYGTMEYELVSIDTSRTLLKNTAVLRGSAHVIFDSLIGVRIKHAVSQNLESLQHILER